MRARGQPLSLEQMGSRVLSKDPLMTSFFQPRDLNQRASDYIPHPQSHALFIKLLKLRHFTVLPDVIHLRIWVPEKLQLPRHPLPTFPHV